MQMISSLYYSLKAKGIIFPDLEASEKIASEKTKAAENQDYVGDQQEADDIAKAIELSMKEQEKEKSNITTQPIKQAYVFPNLDKFETKIDSKQKSVATEKVYKALYKWITAKIFKLIFLIL